MGGLHQRQALNTVLALWAILVPLLSAICGALVGPVTQRIQVFQPEFPRVVTMAIYTPNEYVRTLCAAGPAGVAVFSAVLGSIIIATRWRAGRHSLWVAGSAFVLNVLFIVSVLCAFALELLRAFPFRGAA